MSSTELAWTPTPTDFRYCHGCQDPERIDNLTTWATGQGIDSDAIATQPLFITREGDGSLLFHGFEIVGPIPASCEYPTYGTEKVYITRPVSEIPPPLVKRCVCGNVPEVLA